MTDDDFHAILLSLQVAIVSTGIVLCLGTPLAWTLANRRFLGRSLILSIVMLPLVLPPTVTGFLLLDLLGRRSIIGAFLESEFQIVFVFHWSGAILASTVTSFPLYFLAARTAFEQVDKQLENVARLLGAGELAVFRHVSLPLAMPQLIAGTVLAFARCMGDFGATLMIAGNIPGRTRTASLALYDATVLGQTTQARTLVAILGGIAIMALWISNQMTRRPR